MLRLIAKPTIVLLMSIVLTPSTIKAANYSFESVYSSLDGLSTFFAPAINDHGVVTFNARVGSTQSVLAGDGGPLTTIVGVGDTFNGTTFAELSLFPAINNNETVVFKARFGTDVEGLFLSESGSISTVVDTTGQFRPSFVNDFGVPDINNQGEVLFRAGLDAGGVQTYITDNGTVTQVLSVPVSGSPSVNDLGVIGYSSLNNVFTREGVTVTDLTSGVLSLNHTASTDINNTDTVAFGFLRGFPNTERGIAKANADSVTIIADDSSDLSNFSVEPGINDQGKVAFLANLNDDRGIFTGPAPLADRVIVVGDSLFGSTVFDLYGSFYRHGLNNHGQIAFTYSLANGQSGIAIATPVPEPPMFLLAASTYAIVGLLTQRRISRVTELQHD